MKKILCLSLALLLIFGTVVLTGCKKEENLKLGLGIHSYYSKATNATEDANGAGEAVSTVAAVLLDSEGKIVKCELDCADNTVEYTAEGRFISKDSFATKYELGNNYGMKKAGFAKEWFEQADAFEALTVGKTIDQVKALMSDNGKGNSDVISAGCTIYVSDFIPAIEKAVSNAKDSGATASHTLKIGTVTEQAGTDATDKKAGSIELTTSFVAAVTDADGKVVASVTDCVSPKFTFDTKGVSSTDTKATLKSKLELGAAYGMKSDYGSKTEWFEHAAAFDATCVGKTSSEIAGLATNEGKAVEALQNAGCTINVNGMVKAAVKATKVG